MAGASATGAARQCGLFSISQIGRRVRRMARRVATLLAAGGRPAESRGARQNVHFRQSLRFLADVGPWLLCGGAPRPSRPRSRRRNRRGCVASVGGEKRYEGVVASAVMRAMFPRRMARAARVPEVGRCVDRAGRAVAGLSAQDRDRGVRAGRRPREERTSRSGSFRSPAPRRSSWRIRWGSTASMD